MGMFDDLRCHATLPDERSHPSFQTKCMDCNLDTYVITSDGRLTVKRYDETKPAEPCVYSGSINFYTSNSNGWYEYRATFIRGRLEELVAVCVPDNHVEQGNGG